MDASVQAESQLKPSSCISIDPSMFCVDLTRHSHSETDALQMIELHCALACFSMPAQMKCSWTEITAWGPKIEWLPHARWATDEHLDFLWGDCWSRRRILLD